MVEITNKPASLGLSFQPARTDIRENAAHKRVHISAQLYQVRPRLSISLLQTHTRMLMRGF